MKSGAKSKLGRKDQLVLVARLAKQLEALAQLNYEALATAEEKARSEYEELREEAKLATLRRDEAKEHLANVRKRRLTLEPKYEKAKSAFEKARKEALAARCDTLKRVPMPQRDAFLLLVVDATLVRIKAADTMREALADVGVSLGITLPPEREREWAEAHGDLRVRLLAAWIVKAQAPPFTPLQQEIMEFARRR